MGTEADPKDPGVEPEPNNPDDPKNQPADKDVDWKAKFAELEKLYAGTKENSEKLLKEKMEAKAKKKEADEKAEQERLARIKEADENNAFKELAAEQKAQIEADRAKYANYEQLVAENEKFKTAAAAQVKELTESLTDTAKANLAVVYPNHEKASVTEQLQNLRAVNKISGVEPGKNPIGNGGQANKAASKYEKDVKEGTVQSILSHLPFKK
jgi:hypothetical protein